MEAAGIAGVLQELASFLKSRDYGAVEVLVVVADSPDGTARIAESQSKLFERFRVIKSGPRKGKGFQVRIGMFEAHGKYRIFMDADLATPLIHLDEVYAATRQGAKVVIAVRSLWQIHKGLMRKVMSSFGNIFIQVLILPGIKDSQCGFKAFEAEACEAVFSRQTMLGWSFDAEILLVARKLGYKITTIEAPDWSDPKSAVKGLVGDSPLKAAVKTFMDTVVIRLNAWSGRYAKPTFKYKSMY